MPCKYCARPLFTAKGRDIPDETAKSICGRCEYARLCNCGTCKRWREMHHIPDQQQAPEVNQ